MAGVLSRPWWPPRALTFWNTPSRSRPLSLLPSFSPTDVTSVSHWPRPHSQRESFTNSEVGERGGDHASSVRTPLRTRGRGAAGRGPRGADRSVRTPVGSASASREALRGSGHAGSCAEAASGRLSFSGQTETNTRMTHGRGGDGPKQRSLASSRAAIRRHLDHPSLDHRHLWGFPPLM